MRNFLVSQIFNHFFQVVEKYVGIVCLQGVTKIADQESLQFLVL